MYTVNIIEKPLVVNLLLVVNACSLSRGRCKTGGGRGSSESCSVSYSEKIAFKVVQMKSLAMYITNQNEVLIYLR